MNSICFSEILDSVWLNELLPTQSTYPSLNYRVNGKS